ncbi:MAG: signal peptidase II [Limisphaerales bacterium]
MDPEIRYGKGRVTPDANKRIFLIAAIGLALDQLTKWIVIQTLPRGGEYMVIPEFFRFVHWGNTGAAWSMFRDNNYGLLIVAIIALVILFQLRRHFGAETKLGQFALGLMFGGIVGNIIDRIAHGHVVDFLYFYVKRRSGTEIGFPAFNVADSAICIGVGLLFVLSWHADESTADNPSPEASTKPELYEPETDSSP